MRCVDSEKRMLPGRPYPIVATWDGEGVNFAIFSAHADKIELCLFGHGEDSAETALNSSTDVVFTTAVCGIPDSHDWSASEN